MKSRTKIQSVSTFFLALTLSCSLVAEKTKKKNVGGSEIVTVKYSEGDLTRAYLQARKLSLEGKLGKAAAIFEQLVAADPENATLNHQLAEIYLKVGNGERALELAERAANKDPKNIGYLSTVGGILASLRRYNEAKAAYAKILKLDPSNLRAYLLTGIVEAESGKLDQAVKTLSRGISKNPDNHMLYFYRAKIYIEKKNKKRAIADYRKSLQLRPTFQEAGLALGLIFESDNKIDKAIEVYKSIRGNGAFKKRLAQLYLQRNDLEKALKVLEDYEKVDGEDYTAIVKIGLIYFELKKYEEAASRFKEILKKEPESDNVRFYLGAVYEEWGKSREAVNEFKKVSKDSSFFKESMLHVGFILKKIDKIREGISFAENLIEDHPQVAEFYDMFAAFYEHEREFEKALKIVAKGLVRFPDDEKLLYFEGALYDKLGERQRSIANMKKILEQNENNAHALNFLGYTYVELGENLKEAEKLLRRAIQLRPNDGFIIDSLGWAYFKLGRIDEAIEKLELASKLQPEEAIIFEHLGDVYLHKKNFRKAEQMYQRAVALSKSKDQKMADKIEKKIAKVQDSKRHPSNK